jgi:hypothetical protein
MPNKILCNSLIRTNILHVVSFDFFAQPKIRSINKINKIHPMPTKPKISNATELNIGNINICGKLQNKVEYINKILAKNTYNMLVLLKTHIYYENT